MTEIIDNSPLSEQSEEISRHCFDLLAVFHAESADAKRVHLLHHLAELDVESVEQSDLPE